MNIVTLAVIGAALPPAGIRSKKAPPSNPSE
jgi:hypothetical protein